MFLNLTTMLKIMGEKEREMGWEGGRNKERGGENVFVKSNQNKSWKEFSVIASDVTPVILFGSGKDNSIIFNFEPLPFISVL